MEGGSVHVDGEGTCLTTEECLLNPNRNPGLSRREIEAHLHDYLGVDKVIWIPRGVPEDETDGHIDNLACFSRPGRVLLTWSDEPDDPQHDVSSEARRILESSTDAQGRPFDVGLLPAPGPLCMTHEEAAGIDPPVSAKPRARGDGASPGSYANFLIASSVVVFPILRSPPRRDRGGGPRGNLPDRAVVGVAREIPARWWQRPLVSGPVAPPLMPRLRRGHGHRLGQDRSGGGRPGISTTKSMTR